MPCSAVVGAQQHVFAPASCTFAALFFIILPRLFFLSSSSSCCQSSLCDPPQPLLHTTSHLLPPPNPLYASSLCIIVIIIVYYYSIIKLLSPSRHAIALSLSAHHLHWIWRFVKSCVIRYDTDVFACVPVFAVCSCFPLLLLHSHLVIPHITQEETQCLVVHAIVTNATCFRGYCDFCLIRVGFTI